MLETNEALKRLFVALLIGLLIGVDRERAELRKRRELFAGVRTFPLIALVGAGLALLSAEVGSWPLVAGLAAVAAISLTSYRRSVRLGHVGATTEVAALATFVLGALAGVGQIIVAGAVGVAVAALLVTKPRLEEFARGISPAELSAALELAVISAIVLPLLPDRGYGPWQALNPFRIWLVVVLVSAVSFAGFVAVRWLGQRAGVFLSAALGALVSSTATTAALAQRSRELPQQGRTLAAACVLASTVMSVRVGVLLAIVRPALLPRLAPALGAMAATGALAGWLLGRGARDDAPQHGHAPVSNPFSLRSALIFGGLYAGTVLLVRGGQTWLGGGGTLLAAGVSGLFDVDAISLAIARQAEPATFERATVGIVLAISSNNVFKGGVAVARGAGRFKRDFVLALGAMTLAGAGAPPAVLLAR